jgi:hypothetical protein
MLGTQCSALERGRRVSVARTDVFCDRRPLVTASGGPRSGPAGKEKASSAAMTEVIVFGPCPQHAAWKPGKAGHLRLRAINDAECEDDLYR